MLSWPGVGKFSPRSEESLRQYERRRLANDTEVLMFCLEQNLLLHQRQLAEIQKLKKNPTLKFFNTYERKKYMHILLIKSEISLLIYEVVYIHFLLFLLP